MWGGIVGTMHMQGAVALKVGVPGPAALASPGTLLEMHSPRPHPRLTQSEPLGVTNPPGDADAHPSLRPTGPDRTLNTPVVPLESLRYYHVSNGPQNKSPDLQGLKSTAIYFTATSSNIRSRFSHLNSKGQAPITGNHSQQMQ